MYGRSLAFYRSIFILILIAISFFSLFSFVLRFPQHSLHRDEEGVGGAAMENEKRMRREIANSNERRRMQSINAGFQSLRSLLPHHEGEKLSKVSAKQRTSYVYLYIYQQYPDDCNICYTKQLAA